MTDMIKERKPGSGALSGVRNVLPASAALVLLFLLLSAVQLSHATAQPCSTDAGCTPGFVCGTSGVCVVANSCTLDADCPFGQVCGGCPSGQICGGAGDARCQSMPTSCNICSRPPGVCTGISIQKQCTSNADCSPGTCDRPQGVCGGVGPAQCMTDADCVAMQCSGGFCGDVGGGVCKPCSTSAECVKKTFEKAVPYLGAVSPWFTIAIVAVLIALLGAGIVYSLGHAFNVEPIKRAGTAEIAQAFASLLLILMLFGAEQFEMSLLDQMEKTTGVVTAAMVHPELFHGAQATGEIRMDPFEISYAFLRKLLACAENQLRFVESSSQFDEFIVNFRLQFTVQFPLVKIPTPAEPLGLIPTFAQRVARDEYLADELTWLMIFLYAQIAVLKFFEMSMFTVFLPIGIILRSFPPTRGAGAVLIAIAIGFYIVYPLVFTILYIGTPPALDGCLVQVPEGTTELQRTCPLAVGSATSQISQAQSASATLEVDMPKVESGASSLKYAAYMYMVVSLGATFLFVRSASSILGADISEIGRSMFRMM